MTAIADMSTTEMRAFSQLVDMVYQGATDPSRWPAILPGIVEWLGARKNLFFTPLHLPAQGGFVFSHNLPESFIDLWRTRYQNGDVWAKGAIEKGLFVEGNVALGHELCPRDELLASDWYKEFLSREDLVHLLAGAVIGVNSRFTLPVSCAFYRGLHDPEFGEAERRKFTLLLPHLSRSVGVMTRLKGAEFKVAASLAALDRLSAGVLLLDRNGAVTFANRSATIMLDQEKGLRLHSRADKPSLAFLKVDDPELREALAAAIRSAIDPDILTTAHFGRHLAIQGKLEGSPYVMQFSSLPVQNEFGHGEHRPRAIVFLTDTAEPIRFNADLLRQTYGLTSAEIRVTELVSAGRSVEEVAQRLGISANTLKSHLRQIYAKTNVDSRARLVKLVLSLSTP